MTSAKQIQFYYAGVSRRFGTPFVDYTRVYESVNAEYCTSAFVHEYGWQVLVNELDTTFEDNLNYIIKKYVRGHKKVATFLRNNKLHTNFFVLGKSNNGVSVVLDYDVDTLFTLDYATLDNILGDAVCLDDLWDYPADDNDEYLGILKASNYCKKGFADSCGGYKQVFLDSYADFVRTEVPRAEVMRKHLDDVTEILAEGRALSDEEFEKYLDLVDEQCADYTQILHNPRYEANSANTFMFDALFGRVQPYKQRINCYKRLFTNLLGLFATPNDSQYKKTTEGVMAVNDESITLQQDELINSFYGYLSAETTKELKDYIHNWCDEAQKPRDFSGKEITLPKEVFDLSLYDADKRTMEKLKEFISSKTESTIVVRCVNRFTPLKSVNAYMQDYRDWYEAFEAISKSVAEVITSGVDLFVFKAKTFEGYTAYCASTFNKFLNMCKGDVSKLYDFEDDMYIDILRHQEYCVAVMSMTNAVDIAVEAHEPVCMRVFDDSFMLSIALSDTTDIEVLPEVYRNIEEEAADKVAPEFIHNLVIDYMSKREAKRRPYTVNHEPLDLSLQHISAYDINVVDLSLLYRAGLMYLMHVIRQDASIRDYLGGGTLPAEAKTVLMQILLRGLVYVSGSLFLNVMFCSTLATSLDDVVNILETQNYPMEKVL